MKQWVVYLVQCADQTIYCGISNDIIKRITVHNAGRGAHYTKTRRPIVLLKTFPVDDRSAALKLEYKIKQMTREEKLGLCGNE